jgi:molecular chaperone GrpE
MGEAENIGLPETESSGVEEYRSRLERLQADFTNYKRRVEREREQQSKLANKDLILRILPVLDDFGKAFKSVPGEAANSDWVVGIALVERNLRSILAEEGLNRIDAEGKEFDPEVHEAIFTEEGGEDEQGKIKLVFRDGYYLHDKLIRPAQVSVIKGVKRLPKSVARQKIPVRRGGSKTWVEPSPAPNVGATFL